MKIYTHMEELNHPGTPGKNAAVWGPFLFTGTGPKLFKIDIRQMRPQDLIDALEGWLPKGKEWEAGMELYGALRRGVAFGGDWKGLGSMTTMRSLGRSLGISGLPGFSDLIRTFNFQGPLMSGKEREGAHQEPRLEGEVRRGRRGGRRGGWIDRRRIRRRHPRGRCHRCSGWSGRARCVGAGLRLPPRLARADQHGAALHPVAHVRRRPLLRAEHDRDGALRTAPDVLAEAIHQGPRRHEVALPRRAGLR